MFKQIKSPVFLALDVDNDREALLLAEKVRDYVGGFKIGPRLCMRYGEAFVQQLAQLGHVFIDNKYYDIPNTMLHAVRASFESGASFVTVHAQAGAEALRLLADLESALNKERPFQILAVTVLTSFTEQNLPPNLRPQPIDQQVKELTQLTMESGLRGYVCSPLEVKMLKSLFPASFAVTPGIRFTEENKDDQKRTLGPREAIMAGSSLLVVGRPIVQAKNPREAAERFFEAAKVRSIG
ncbi:MAG: orotidine-5'-phosphate decarboxylase [Bdellovibrionales bacterium]|nr:orotidine-5'-phosphate decarboxylase [Bdellovibrionales bacterium]